jgi:DNA-binding phage protein
VSHPEGKPVQEREYTLLPDHVQKRLETVANARPVSHIAQFTRTPAKEIYRALSDQTIHVETARRLTEVYGVPIYRR